MTIAMINSFFDKWRWVGALIAVLGVMGVSVAWPGTRITKLEEQRIDDRAQLDKTTGYMRLLATATCLRDDHKENTLLAQMCARVLSDPTVFELPR
jgi:hypothetical protein